MVSWHIMTTKLITQPPPTHLLWPFIPYPYLKKKSPEKEIVDLNISRSTSWSTSPLKVESMTRHLTLSHVARCQSACSLGSVENEHSYGSCHEQDKKRHSTVYRALMAVYTVSRGKDTSVSVYLAFAPSCCQSFMKEVRYTYCVTCLGMVVWQTCLLKSNCIFGDRFWEKNPL